MYRSLRVGAREVAGRTAYRQGWGGRRFRRRRRNRDIGSRVPDQADVSLIYINGDWGSGNYMS